MKTKQITDNIIFTLDSYKHSHPDMLPEGTKNVASYLEARKGAMYDYTILFSLQYNLLHWMVGEVITREKINEAEWLLEEHFKYSGRIFKRERWDYIVEKHGGKLPLRIKAVKEGIKVPVSNVLVFVEATDDNCAWLTNAMETLLQQVHYGTTVCTRSHFIVNIIKNYYKWTVEDSNQWLSAFYLHDFGQRAAKGMEAASIGGAAHLINSLGTDTVMGMKFAIDFYGAPRENLGYSVPASEHSIGTSLREEGEFIVAGNLIKIFPKGILSVVSDNYDITNAVNKYCTELKSAILGRDGKFVIRPDSPRFEGDTPQDQVLWIAEELWKGFSGIINSKGFKVLDSHVGIIYGDSLTEHDIRNILQKLYENKFSAETCVFGCGGYLLDKLNRDTERFAFKSCAQFRNGKWEDVYKQPKDGSKISKKGRLALVHYDKEWTTVPESLCIPGENQLEVVFENGEIKRFQTFDEIKKLAAS